MRGEKRRRLHKAFLRYHDPNNWPLLREALKAMGRADLIGNGKHHLIPTYQAGHRRRLHQRAAHQLPRRQGGRGRGVNAAAAGTSQRPNAPRPGQILTQHTGLPPRAGDGGGPGPRSERRADRAHCPAVFCQKWSKLSEIRMRTGVRHGPQRHGHPHDQPA